MEEDLPSQFKETNWIKKEIFLMKLMNTVVSKVYSMKRWQKVTAFILMFVIFVAGLGVIFVQSQVGKSKEKR